MMTMDECEKTQDLSQMRCETTSPGVQECALCASSAHDVHHASVCVNVVIGVLVVLRELHAIVRVHVIQLCDDAVVGLTLGHRSCCYRRFRPGHFFMEFSFMGDTLFAESEQGRP